MGIGLFLLGLSTFKEKEKELTKTGKDYPDFPLDRSFLLLHRTLKYKHFSYCSTQTKLKTHFLLL